MATDTTSQPKSMRTFLIIWIGQFISTIGSGLTGFGLSVWIFTQTGKATPMALTALAYNVPYILLSPIAGTVVDRFNRKTILILADTASVLVTAWFGFLIFTDSLQVWHIYLGTAVSSMFSTFQWPAYSASITMIVPKKHLTRAAGIQQIGNATRSILIPVLAGVLYGLIGFRGIIVIDFLTYFFAIGALVWVTIPQPDIKTEAESGDKTSMLKDAVFGFKWLKERPGLLSLLFYFASVNFFLSFFGVLIAPLVLSFGTSTDMGLVEMAGGIGMLAGGLLIGSWGGPKTKRIWWVILTIFLSAFGFLIIGIRPQVWTIGLGMFAFLFFIPIASAVSQGVWQMKTPPHVQGRVFAIRGMIASAIEPLANLLAGPLADKVFEPRMAVDGAWANSWIADLIGTGKGRGIAVIFLISAGFMWLVSLVVFTYPRVRNLEDEIPDAIPDEEPEEAAEE